MSVSLKSLNTFGIQANAEQVIYADNEHQLRTAWQDAVQKKKPAIILGGGSNILLLSDFSGSVILNRLCGITIHETEDAWHLHVGAGENWHGLVKYTLNKGIAGLENMALIPGCVGSAPIQNIGAYGCELQNVCEYVDCLNLVSGARKRLSAQECQFGYRDSVFKHSEMADTAIVAVGISLSKDWRPILNYGDLKQLDAETVTPRQIFDVVCHMRRSKLPDPDITGNAGSFFKNPVVNEQQAKLLLQHHPDAPYYLQPDGSIKLAAGWLIDRCELKGYRYGGAAVHRKQALVLINVGDATGQDVVALARHVRRCVGETFNIWLEPEVRFIGSQGEINSVETIA